jgi:hypothetical protein
VSRWWRAGCGRDRLAGQWGSGWFRRHHPAPGRGSRVSGTAWRAVGSPGADDQALAGLAVVGAFRGLFFTPVSSCQGVVGLAVEDDRVDAALPDTGIWTLYRFASRWWRAQVRLGVWARRRYSGMLCGAAAGGDHLFGLDKQAAESPGSKKRIQVGRHPAQRGGHAGPVGGGPVRCSPSCRPRACLHTPTSACCGRAGALTRFGPASWTPAVLPTELHVCSTPQEESHPLVPVQLRKRELVGRGAPCWQLQR